MTAQPRFLPRFTAAFPLLLSLCTASAIAADAPTAKTAADSNPLRRNAKTGHVSNYEEEKVGRYTLPDPLVLRNGQPVREAEAWTKQRRPEIIALYEREIFGRVPERAPKAWWRKTRRRSTARRCASASWWSSARRRVS